MLCRFGGALARLPPLLKPSHLLFPHKTSLRFFAGEADVTAYEDETGIDPDGLIAEEEEEAEEARGKQFGRGRKAVVNPNKPDGPGTDSDADSPHIARLQEEFMRPEYQRDPLQADRDEIREELAFRQRNLSELDKIISEDWVMNHNNGVYFNPTTGETKVPFEQSFEAYKERRARRERTRTVAQANAAYPDFISRHYLLKEAQFYPEAEMTFIRDKYKHLNFKELGDVLADADHQFFKRDPTWSLQKWGVTYPYTGGQSEATLQHELEHLRFLALLPHKYHVKTLRVGHMTETGRKMGVGVLVVGGTGNGYVGYGYGKGPSPVEALRKASHNLRRNMLEVPLDEGRTIPFSVIGKYRTTKVIMQRCTRGRGIRGGPLMQAVYECAGLEDVSSKITGSRIKNPMSIVQAVFQGLAQLVSPRQLAQFRGVNYYTEYGGPIREPPPSPEEMTRRTSKIKEYIKDAESQWSKRTDLNHDLDEPEEWGEEATLGGGPSIPPPTEGEEPKKQRRTRTEELHQMYYPWTLPKRTNPSRPRPRPGQFQGPELKSID
jgi:small subunit ribosomal protein S5